MKLKNNSNPTYDYSPIIITISAIAYYSLLLFVALFISIIPFKLILLGLFVPPILSLLFLNPAKMILGFFLLQIGIQIFFVQQYIVSNFTMMLPLLLGLMLLNNEKSIRFDDPLIWKIIMLNLLCLIFSTLTAQNPLSSVYMLLNFSQAFLVFLFFVWYIDSEISLKTVFKLYLIGSLIPILVGLLQILNVLGSDEINRIQGTFMSSNEFAPFLVFNFLIFLSLGFYIQKNYIKICLFGLSLINLYIFFYTYSRGAMVGILGAIITYVFIKTRTKKAVIVILVGFLILVLLSLSVTLGLNKFFSRFTEIENGGYDFSTLERIGVWESALKLFKNSPITGVGINNFHEMYPKFFPTYGVRLYSDKLYHSHNIFLNTLAEQGIIGFIVLVISLLFIVKKLILMKRSVLTRLDSHLIPFLFSFFVYFVLHNLFDCVWTAYYHVALQMQLALYFAILLYVNKVRINQKVRSI